MPRRPDRQRGMTLVELLIVVTILAIVSGLFYTRTVAAKRDARDAQVITVIDALRTAAQAYAARTNTWPRNLTTNSDVTANWDVLVAQIETTVGDLHLPRWTDLAQMTGGSGAGVRISASAVVGDDYSIWMKPGSAGSGVWWRATPYAVYTCTTAPWDTSGCTLNLK